MPVNKPLRVFIKILAIIGLVTVLPAMSLTGWIIPIRPDWVQLWILCLFIVAIALAVHWFLQRKHRDVWIKQPVLRGIIAALFLIGNAFMLSYAYKHPNGLFSSYWGRLKLASSDHTLFFYSDGILIKSTVVKRSDGLLFTTDLNDAAPEECHPTRLSFQRTADELMIIGCNRVYSWNPATDHIQRTALSSPEEVGDEVSPLLMAPVAVASIIGDAFAESREPVENYTGPLE